MSRGVVQYRDGVPTDRDTITEFQIAMAWETERLKLDPEICLKGVQAVFDQPARGRYFVAETTRVLGALLMIPEWSDWRNGEVWWIHSVYVRENERGQGIYRGLYDHVRNRVQADPGLRGLRLYVDKTNVHAQKVYEHLGMSADHYLLYEWMKR